MIEMETSISPLFLRTFRRAYELKNFTETAKKLGMTQSGVSQHMAHIEEIIQTPLFERVGRGIIPTFTADKLYSFGGRWLSEMEDFIHETKKGESELAGRVTLGAPGSFGVYLLKSLISWQTKNPRIILDFEYGPTATMERALQVGKMDLAITSEALGTKLFSSQEFFREEYVLVSHPDLKPRLGNWDDFCSNPFIDYVGSDSIFQKWISMHYKNKKNFMQSLNVRIRINNMESIFYLLEQKVGMTIFPVEPLLDLIHSKRLKAYKTGRTVTSPLYIVKRQGQTFSKRVQSLHEVILAISSK